MMSQYTSITDITCTNNNRNTLYCRLTFPLPVWPYANMHTLYPSSTDTHRGWIVSKTCNSSNSRNGMRCNYVLKIKKRHRISLEKRNNNHQRHIYSDSFRGIFQSSWHVVSTFQCDSLFHKSLFFALLNTYTSLTLCISEHSVSLILLYFYSFCISEPLIFFVFCT